MQSKSILAKLLARENITIQHGSYETASFNLEQRTLCLPLLKEMDKNVYDLFIGHEVGHALETPTDGWHDSAFDIPGCPRAFINVVEDIRIEKLIQRRYPGLVHSFKKGYANLKDRDFFGVGDKDINTMSFMNRLNLKAKLRDLVDVDFTEEEQPYFKMAMAVETWDDVIAACRSIYEYLKEKQNNEQKEQEGPDNNGGEGPNEDSLDEGDGAELPGKMDNEDGEFDDSDSSGEGDSLDSSQDNNDSLQDSEYKNRSDDEKNSEGKDEIASSGVAGSDPFTAEQDLMDVSTDDNFRKNESELLERDKYGNVPLVINEVSSTQIDDMITPYSEIAKARKKQNSIVSGSEVIPNNFYGLEYDVRYKEFVDETTKIVNVMVKEFEMRKAAFQYSRAKSSRTGSLNVNKLHEYKFNDDIFRKVTKLADAKSHGMVMVIDRSGSMREILADVTRQVLTLAMFCKKVGIPFDVYTFTSLHKDSPINHKYSPGDIEHSHVNICHMLSSTFKKSDYNEAFRDMFNQTVGNRHEQYMLYSDPERMGGTPLVETLLVMPALLAKFKQRHGVQKVIMPLLTDGDASPPVMISDVDSSGWARPQGLHFHSFYVNVGGNKYIKLNERNATANLLEHIRSMGVTTIGYFLAQSGSAFNYKVGHASKVWDKEHFREVNKKLRAQKFVSFDNTLGYDRYFILKVNSTTLSTEIDEFEVKEGARAGEITRAFKKYASAKKTNRIFAAQFAEIVS